MRAPVLMLFVLAASTFAFAARRASVQELTQILTSLHDAHKTDEEVATKLKQIQLSEELTTSAATALEQYLPGPLSTEQLEILRDLSVFEQPVPSASPAAPAPDAHAVLGRTATWLSSAFGQSPAFTASKVILRFQDDVVNMSSSAGLQVDSPNTYTRFAEARTDTVESAQGIEKLVSDRDKTKWGENGQISEGGPIPPLPELFQQASASEKMTFSRWDTIGSSSVAVFTFSVDKKKSRYNVSYCCFPSTDTSTGAANAGFGLSPGQVQSVTTWHPFKKAVPYHGLLYIDPATGAVLRTVTFAELKPSDFIHAENVRIDYGSATVGGKTCIVPLSSIVLNETVPGGDSGTRGYSARHALFAITYGNFRP